LVICPRFVRVALTVAINNPRSEGDETRKLDAVDRQ
jgi:hypothetical protein